MASPPHKDDPDSREKDKSNGPSRWLSVKKKGPTSRSKSRERKLADDERSDSMDSGKQDKSEKEKFKPLSGDALRNFFAKEKGKEKVVEDLDPNVAPQKVSLVRDMLAGMRVTADTIEIKRALASPYANGEPNKAAPLIDIWQKSAAGIVVPYNKSVHMLGAVNVNCVTCYLDALFFSMFAKLAVFECMLSFDFPKDKTGNKKRLARLLCLWVNLVRSGFLVLEDVTIEIQKALAACGWPEAQEIQQQDTTEAFNFITDVLEFPLQPLRMNIAHGGKVDEGDDKIAFERLINVAIPEHRPEEGIRLEECLANYFNAQPIKVERMAHEPEKKEQATEASTSRIPLLDTAPVKEETEATLPPEGIVASPVTICPPEPKTVETSEGPSMRPSDGDQITEETDLCGKEGSEGSRVDSKMNGYESEAYSLEEKPSSKAPSVDHVEEQEQETGKDTPTEQQGRANEPQSNGVQMDQSSSHAEPGIISPERTGNSIAHSFVAPSESDAGAQEVSVRPSRDRASSIIQNVYVDEHGNQLMLDETTRQKLKRQGSSMVKAITIPAWQFFRLVPWHNVKGQPSTDFEVAAEFKKRPVVGVCLKRYEYNNRGQMARLEAKIDIPEEMKLPYTLFSEEQAGPSGEPLKLPREYKLVLQSVICHRGRDLSSGHYICFTRVASKRLRENRRHDFDPPPDYEQAQWVRYDDLVDEGRVKYVSDFQQAIDVEFPYLLFYQVMPLQDDEPPPSDTSDEPPSYEEQFRVSIEEPSTPVPANMANAADDAEHATPDARHLQSPSRPTSRPSSIRSRPSTEIDHSRKGSDDSRRYPRNPFSSRPSSMNLDSAMQSPVRTPDVQNSPMLSPADETTASRLSRAAAAFRGKQSRNQSQAGETRSAGADMINRMTGILRAASREPLGEPSSLNLSSNTNSRANTNARTSVDSTYRPSLENYKEDLKSTEKSGGFLSRSGSQKRKDKANVTVKEKSEKPEKPDKSKVKDSKGDKTPKGDGNQPDRECNVM